MAEKHRKIFGLALKVAIVLLALGYIAKRFFDTNDPLEIPLRLFRTIKYFPLKFLLVLFLMCINWMLEGWKWQLAAAQQVKISFAKAMKGVLAGVTIGTATPNRVGEFAGRIFMEKEEDRVSLVFLSFVCSFCQVLVTFLAGIAGILLLENNAGLSKDELLFIYAAGILFCCSPLLLYFLPVKWKEKAVKLRTFPLPVFFKILLLSALRYSVYVFQFMLLLTMMRPDMFTVEMLGCILVAYLVVTIIPTFSFTEVFIRGSIAGLIFSAAGFERIAVTVAVFLWLINVAIPSLIGSVFVFRLKFSGKET
jgi:hypothetical protein